jgi:hypothetical protein
MFSLSKRHMFILDRYGLGSSLRIAWEVHAERAYASPNGAKLEDVSAQSWGRYLGL